MTFSFPGFLLVFRCMDLRVSDGVVWTPLYVLCYMYYGILSMDGWMVFYPSAHPRAFKYTSSRGPEYVCICEAIIKFKAPERTFIGLSSLVGFRRPETLEG